MRTFKARFFSPLIIFCVLSTAMVTGPHETAARENAEHETSTSAATSKKIINRASEIMGREVINEKGERLGFSKDLIIDKNGRVAYLVLLRGSAFGTVGPLVPLPWSLVVLQEADQPLLAGVDYQAIKDAPGFPLDKWPDFFLPERVEAIQKHYREFMQ